MASKTDLGLPAALEVPAIGLIDLSFEKKLELYCYCIPQKGVIDVCWSYIGYIANDLDWEMEKVHNGPSKT
jgi:hypothetical protein